MKLDLGCGSNKRVGFTGIDMHPHLCVDILSDIDKEGIKVEVDSVSHLVADNFLEHTLKLGMIMNEIYHVCKNGAIVEIIVPHFKHPPCEEHVREFKHSSLKNYEVGNDNPGYRKFLKCLERRLTIRNRLLNFIFRNHPYAFELFYPFRTHSMIYMKFKVVKR